MQNLTKQEQKMTNGLKRIEICSLCNYTYNKGKLVNCSAKKCKNKYCFNCMTMIDNRPFCPSCVKEIIEKKCHVIITKGELI